MVRWVMLNVSKILKEVIRGYSLDVKLQRRLLPVRGEGQLLRVVVKCQNSQAGGPRCP